MEPAITFRFSDLPLELALLVLKYAAESTFSQKEKYTEKNPYADAISLCHVSRLVRRTVLPELLHTVSLRRCHGVRMFANALLMQQAYAETKSDLFFDYTSAVQRVWISHNDFAELRLHDTEVKKYMDSLVPVLLAAPALAIDSYNLKLFIQSVDDAWTSRAALDVDDKHSPFPVRTQSLTITARGPFSKWDIFKYIPKGSVFLASISSLTFLADGSGYPEVSRGLISPEYPLRLWMHHMPWACMKNLQTFSVVYPHMSAHYDLAKYIQKGRRFHVEKLTVNVPLFKQDPVSFPWVAPPFPVTNPGEKSIRSDGVSFTVTQDRAKFCQYFFTWDKVWACGLTE
ncbi:hypothetical protein BDR04DRAFT_1196846 [Suillus decipiens]|nr:hypothetical protein BDR04DRAFT_1196846 [Suillus decipiens]